MKKYKLALFIGRFQPFHKGPLYSLEKAMELGERVVVGIGSSQKSRSESNPWSYEEREQMVRVVVGGEVMIVGIEDYQTDSEWAEKVVEIVESEGCEPHEVVVVGNNSWTNEVLEEVGMQVLESGLHNRDELEGVKIREMLRAGQTGWRERVPEEMIEMIG